jgi:hypothetical protein
MAQAALVESQFNAGQTLINRLPYEKVTVTAAAWVKESDTGDWYLYLATPLVSEGESTRMAYRAVNAAILKMQQEDGFERESLEIKVIGPYNPITRDLVANRGRPGGPPVPFRGSRLGELYVEEAYIYPPIPNQEEQTGIQLWECGRTELRPGIGPAGLCRMVVIDLKSQSVLRKRTCHGIMANPHSLEHGQLEVTWAEGGAVRILGTATQRWKWSQPRATWEEGDCPPDEIRDAILTAMG